MIFGLNQKKIYAELNGNGIISNDVPNAEECTKFWDKRAQQRGKMAERSEERERVNEERPQERVSITVEKIRKQCKKIPN